jgi:hypothetical protein
MQPTAILAREERRINDPSLLLVAATVTHWRA